MASNWHVDDDKPLTELLAEYQAKYGRKAAKVIAKALFSDPPPRRNGLRAKDAYGRRTHKVVGAPENPDAPPSAVDFRHHRSRIETGR